jgi:hypothetical protein
MVSTDVYNNTRLIVVRIKSKSMMSHHIKQRIRVVRTNKSYYNNIVCSILSLVLLVAVLYNTPITYYSVSTTVMAEKDSNWYQYGKNPNTKFSMYWKDAQNVLQDLSKFRSLHIKYHGCV